MSTQNPKEVNLQRFLAKFDLRASDFGTDDSPVTIKRAHALTSLHFVLGLLSAIEQDPDHMLSAAKLSELRKLAEKRIAELQSEIESEAAKVSLGKEYPENISHPPEPQPPKPRNISSPTTVQDPRTNGVVRRRNLSPGINDEDPPDSVTKEQLKLQDQYSDELLRMAAALKSSSLLFGETLKKDEKIREDAYQALQSSVDKVSKASSRLNKITKRASGTFWMMIGSILLVFVLSSFTFFVIRFL